jgi:hypothetical protein
MNNNISENISDKIAGTISVIFHPLLVPVYGLAIIFVAPTLYNYLPFEVKKLIILIVLVNNILLPLSLLPIFIHRNLISSWLMNERKDRVVPLVLSTILYFITTYLIFRFQVPNFLKSYFLAAAFLSLAATMINFWWKISLHGIGAGVLFSLVLILSLKMYTPLLWYIIPAIIATGFIMTSRLQLNLHNPGQVWLGFLTGVLGFSIIMLLF